jgi:hypothetical protein
MDEQICERIGNLNLDGEKEESENFNEKIRKTMDYGSRQRIGINVMEENPFAKETYVKSRKGDETELMLEL